MVGPDFSAEERQAMNSVALCVLDRDLHHRSNIARSIVAMILVTIASTLFSGRQRRKPAMTCKIGEETRHVVHMVP
jgi:hypothetical protein